MGEGGTGRGRGRWEKAWLSLQLLSLVVSAAHLLSFALVCIVVRPLLKISLKMQVHLEAPCRAAAGGRRAGGAVRVHPASKSRMGVGKCGDPPGPRAAGETGHTQEPRWSGRPFFLGVQAPMGWAWEGRSGSGRKFSGFRRDAQGSGSELGCEGLEGRTQSWVGGLGTP